MSDENTQTTGQEQSTTGSQETTNSEVTPAQENKDTKSTDTTQSNEWTYDGNRETVPEPFKKYAAGFDRYISKKDQALAEAQKQLAEYKQKLASVPQPTVPTEPVTTDVEFTQDELDAIALGDAKTFKKVLDRAVESRTKSIESKISDQLSPIAMKQRELDAAEEISAFKSIHPDFQELLESPAGEFMIDAARRGANLDQIYDTAKKAQSFFETKAEEKRQKNLQMKKDGSVVSRSVPGTPEIVYAETENDAKRLAIELELKGDKRLVQVKPKR